MALPENSIPYTDLIGLTPDDVTDEALDRLHSGIDESAVLSWALAREAVRVRPHVPARFVDLTDDADLFAEIMR
jgi:hypothetical protein